MKMNIKGFAYALLALSGLFFAACDSGVEDGDIVIDGCSCNLVYFKANADNTFKGTVVHTPVGHFGGVSAVFPVAIQRPAASNTTVKAVIDNSLIDVYNKAHGTDYVAMPEGAVETAGLTVQIQKDSLKAQDAVKLSLKESALPTLTAAGYLLPVRIAEVSGDGRGSEERGVGYVIVTTKEKLVKDITSPDEMVGKLVADYAGWTARYGSNTTIQAEQLFDGDLTNGAQLRDDGADGKTKTVIVDMAAVKKVSGLRFARYYKSYYGGWWKEEFYFSTVKIEVSENGTDWLTAGTVTEGEMPKADGYQHVTFYGGTKCRYLRLTIESGSSSVSSLAELGVYTQE